MASIQTRNSVLAIVKETNEGTLKGPTGSTSYVALQEGFSMEPNFENLTNDELKSSIGITKPIVGAEAPSASLSHYVRHSGTEGTAPNFGPLLESCLGSVSVAGTEYDTVSSSTTTLIKVNTGEGVNFPRGTALLIKDATNGYRIRGVDSVSGDDITIGFALPAGPAANVNLGKSVTYKPANTGHPTLSLHHYLGQGGAVQSMAGGRCTNMNIDISAGALINASYTVEGIEYFYDPIEITSTTDQIIFSIGGGDLTATLANKWYKTPHDLASAVQTAISGAAAGTYTCTYSDSTGKFTVTKSTGTFAVKWLTGTDSAGAKLGFTADDTGALTYTSDNAISLASPHTPSFDVSDPLAAKDNEVMLGIQSEYTCFKADTVTVDIATPKADIGSVCATSGKDGSVITSREVTISVTALLEQYDAKQFERFRQGTPVKFQYSFGTKSGGNWVAGKCGMVYSPSATISSFGIQDSNGLAQLSLELKAYVNDSGEGEFYIAFV